VALNHEQQADRLEAALSDDDRALLDELADRIARRRLVAAAMMFFESVKPLNFVTSQMMVFFRPMVQVLWSEPHRYDQVARLLEQRGTVELLLRRLEARA
jgi:hypothetical protein